MTCKTCGKNSDSDYCFKHKPKKPLPSGKKPTLSSKKVLSVGKSQPTNELSEIKKFFVDIWKKKEHKSEVSGTSLGKEPSTAFFHHILPKSKYPQACFDEENIILLTLDEHANVESDIYKYEIINNKRTYLLEKWKLK